MASGDAGGNPVGSGSSVASAGDKSTTSAAAQAASFVAGLSLPNNRHGGGGGPDAASMLQLARPDGYEFCVTSLPLFPHPGAGAGGGNSAGLPLPRRDVTNLESKWWTTSIVGEVPPLMGDEEGASQHHHHGHHGHGHPDSDAVMGSPDGEGGGGGGGGHGHGLVEKLSSPDPSDRLRAEAALTQMVGWACHMSIPALIMPAIPTPSPSSSPATGAAASASSADDDEMVLNYARLLCSLSHQCSASNVQIWVRVPFSSPALHAFDVLYHRADAPSNLGCMLCFGRTPGPSTAASAAADQAGPGGVGSNVLSSQGLLHKFVGCNLRAVSFSTSVFLTNKRGYPTLSKSYQILFTQLLRRIGRTVRVLVEGGQRHYPPSTVPSADGTTPGVNPNGGTGCLAYLQYLRHLRARPEVSGVLDTPEAEMEGAYLDHLQSPLQPLADDLEFQTYETFEKDPVKYAKYQSAIELALRDGLLNGTFDKLDDGGGGGGGGGVVGCGGDRRSVVILVVGAGRGPLVHASLLAVDAINRVAKDAGEGGHIGPTIHPHVIAVEKNPSAVLFLKSLLRYGGDLWDERCITVVDSDVRDLTPQMLDSCLLPTRGRRGIGRGADLVVSELLGSFGDNELSPECLYAAERCPGILKPDTAVSIPSRYISYLAPVSSMRLHAEARAQSYGPGCPTDGPAGQPAGMQRAMETPYVVRPYAASQLHAELPCFDFYHPMAKGGGIGPGGAADRQQRDGGSNRFTRMEFRPDPTSGAGCGCGFGPFDANVSAMAQTTPREPSRGTSVHGFLGTFEAVLYQSSRDGASSSISTAPSSFSQGMFSWFPLYFPLREPLHVPSDGTLVASFWRRSSGGGGNVEGGGGWPGGRTGAGGRVWYEWCAEVRTPTSSAITGGAGGPPPPETDSIVTAVSNIHNPGGRSYHVGL